MRELAALCGGLVAAAEGGGEAGEAGARTRVRVEPLASAAGAPHGGQTQHMGTQAEDGSASARARDRTSSSRVTTDTIKLCVLAASPAPLDGVLAAAAASSGDGPGAGDISARASAPAEADACTNARAPTPTRAGSAPPTSASKPRAAEGLAPALAQGRGVREAASPPVPGSAPQPAPSPQAGAPTTHATPAGPAEGRALETDPSRRAAQPRAEAAAESAARAPTVPSPSPHRRQSAPVVVAGWRRRRTLAPVDGHDAEDPSARGPSADASAHDDEHAALDTDRGAEEAPVVTRPLLVPPAPSRTNTPRPQPGVVTSSGRPHGKRFSKVLLCERRRGPARAHLPCIASHSPSSHLPSPLCRARAAGARCSRVAGVRPAAPVRERGWRGWRRLHARSRGGAGVRGAGRRPLPWRR